VIGAQVPVPVEAARDQVAGLGIDISLVVTPESADSLVRENVEDLGGHPGWTEAGEEEHAPQGSQ
jgi:hypothetical protein